MGRLSFRVRNGTGRFPTAMTTVKTFGLRDLTAATWWPVGVVVEDCIVDAYTTP